MITQAAKEVWLLEVKNLVNHQIKRRLEVCHTQDYESVGSLTSGTRSSDVETVISFLELENLPVISRKNARKQCSNEGLTLETSAFGIL